MDGRTDWRLVWLLWGAGLGAAGQYAKISVIFELLPEVYPDAGAGLGFAVSLVGFVGIVLGVAAGVLVARIGYRRALLYALVAGAAVSAAQATWPPLWLFLTLRVVEGVAHLAIVVAGPTLIAEVTRPADQGRALTLWGSFFGVAFAVFAWAGVPLADRLGLSALMLAHGAFMGVMAAVLWRRVPVLVPKVRPVRIGELFRAHIRIYSSPRIGASAAGWLFYTICFVSVLTVMPPFIAPEWRVFTVGAMPMLSILSSLTLGVWLLRFTSAVAVVVLGFALCAGFALALIWFPGAPTLAMGLGAGLGLIQGASFAAVPQLNDPPADRALANGGMAQMGNLGNTAGTPLMLAVIGLGGHSGLMTALALAFAGGGAVHLAMSRRRSA